MPRTANLVYYLWLMRPGTLENRILSLFKMSTISKYILIVTDKCGSYPSSKKLEFALDRDHYRNPLVKMQKLINRGVLSPKLYVYKTIPTPKFREHPRRGHRKVVGGRGPGHLLKDGVFPFDKDTAPRKSQQHGCPDKTCTIRTPVYHSAWIGAISKGPIPRSRATSTEWPLGEGETVFSRDKCQS